jgi:hypothetical protein
VVLQDLGAPAGYGGFISFVTVNADFTRALVGFTTLDYSDDRVYELDLTQSTPAWDQVATFAQNYDAAYVGSDIFISGKNNGTFAPDNAIWKLDTSGANAHDLILQTNGYSAGLAFDSAGNLYYGTNGTGNDQLVFLTAAQIDSALGAGSLALTDAQVLSLLEGGGGDVTVFGDQVYFSMTSFGMSGVEGFVAVYDPALGGDHKYALLGTGGEFFTYLSADETGVFQNAYGVDGLALITPVPESGTGGLAVLAFSGLVIIRRRRGSFLPPFARSCPGSRI